MHVCACSGITCMTVLWGLILLVVSALQCYKFQQVCSADCILFHVIFYIVDAALGNQLNDFSIFL